MGRRDGKPSHDSANFRAIGGLLVIACSYFFIAANQFWDGGFYLEFAEYITVGSFLFLLGILGVVWSYRRDNAIKRKLLGRCPVCSYDLTGNTSGTCPECGTAVL